MSDKIRIKRALISVSDKTGLVPFVRRLEAMGARIISTGGTAKVLQEAGIAVTAVDEVTGWPEMMDGRVKTLHPRVHGGLLALRDHPDHQKAMSGHGIEPIDLVCINLYPFEKTVANPGVAVEQAIEQIDIGGPSMIRSGAKNHRYVAVVTDPKQYDLVSGELDAHEGCTTLALRARLAAAAFARTAAYDAAIAQWTAKHLRHDTPEVAPESAPESAREGAPDGGSSGQLFPEKLMLGLDRVSLLRYGENPHQAAALYRSQDSTSEPNVVSARQLHGKELSFNNLNDAAAALELVKEFDAPAAAVIKHTNPCGCAVADALAGAFENAYAGDPLAAFGGIVALNRTVDDATAQAITGPGPGGAAKFLEVIIAPEYYPSALEILKQRWKNVRILATAPGIAPAPGSSPGSGPGAGPGQRDRGQWDLKGILGGMLVQQRDLPDSASDDWKLAGGPAADDDQMSTLRLAWRVAKHVKSNAIVLARDNAIVGVGAGQMDRVESCKIAVAKANAGELNRSAGSVAASDAFFPFRDGPDVLIQAGVEAIVQPGGSVRDDQTIAACNEAGVALYFTGRRHFRH